MSTAHGASNSSRTYAIDVLFHPAFIQAVFPGAEKISTFRGTWQRIDENILAFSVIALDSDSDNQTIGIVKMSGYDTLIESCSQIEIAATYELFLLNKNPFTDTPYFSTNLPIHYGYRMAIDADAP